MSTVSLLVRHNFKWILAFSMIFAYACGVLANGSGLSLWYSTRLTEEFSSSSDVDFTINQLDALDMAQEVSGRIKALEEVRGVVTMIDFFSGRIEVYTANGTKIVKHGGLHFTSYFGLEDWLGKNEPYIQTPQPGMAVISQDIAEELNIQPGGNLTIETIYPTSIAFTVTGVTNDSCFGIPYPRSLVIVSWEDFVDLALAMNANVKINIKHYTYCERGNLVEPANMDGSLTNFMRVREKMELLIFDVPVRIDSLLLELFQNAVPNVDLLSIITYGYMLAALPLYWLVASTLINIFLKSKRREIALFRLKGMSARSILSIYLTVVLISAVLGSLLGAVLQENVVRMLMERYAGWVRNDGLDGVSGLVFPDLTSFIILLFLGLILGVIAFWRLFKSVVSLQPIEAVDHLPANESTRPKRLSKLAMVLLALGLVKVALVMSGLDSTVYFKNPPSNPYVAMTLGLFATFDTYALNAFAPVFSVYGFANLVSAKSALFKGLFKVLSYSAGLKRRRISFRIVSSEMWRVSGSFFLVTLIVSYGVTGYVNYNSLTDHVWKMAGEFTGSDIRIDCTPNDTQQVEEMVKNLTHALSYARIDVMVSKFGVEHFMSGLGGSRASMGIYGAFMILDPERYTMTAYLDNAPELRSILTSLENESLIGMRESYDRRYFEGALITEGYLPPAIEGGPRKWVKVQGWLDLPLPGTLENPETISVSSSTENLRRAIHPYVKTLIYEESLADAPLWSIAGFTTIIETLSDSSYQHVKTHFIIKLKPKTDVKSLAGSLRNNLTQNVMIITRTDATTLITKSIPRLAISLAFAQMNCILITAISLGGIAAVTIVNGAARSKILSFLRIRGGTKLDGIAIFLPEAVFVSLLAGVTGVLIGLLLAVPYTKSLADLVPSLFTRGNLQLSFGWSIWLFLGLTLTIYIFLHIIATAYQAKISKSRG